VGYKFRWSARFLDTHVSPLSVGDRIDHGTGAELASKLAWAIGTTLELPYKKESQIREDCKFLAKFIMENLAD